MKANEEITVSWWFHFLGFVFGVAFYAILALVLVRDDFIGGIGEIVSAATEPMAALAGIILGLYLSVSITGLCFGTMGECMGIILAYIKKRRSEHT